MTISEQIYIRHIIYIIYILEKNWLHNMQNFLLSYVGIKNDPQEDIFNSVNDNLH